MIVPPSALPTPAALPANTTPTAVRLDAFQAFAQGHAQPGMGQALTNAMDGFGARAANMQASMRDMVSRDTATGPVPAPAGVGATGGVTAGQGGIQSPMRLMMDSFNFAIEASLVSRAATQFTGSISTLMKGQ